MRKFTNGGENARTLFRQVQPSLLLPGCPTNFMWQEVVARDLLCMGVQVVSFTLKDVSDDVDYLSSLGRWAPICHEVDTIT